MAIDDFIISDKDIRDAGDVATTQLRSRVTALGDKILQVRETNRINDFNSFLSKEFLKVNEDLANPQVSDRSSIVVNFEDSLRPRLNSYLEGLSETKRKEADVLVSERLSKLKISAMQSDFKDEVNELKMTAGIKQKQLNESLRGDDPDAINQAVFGVQEVLNQQRNLGLITKEQEQEKMSLVNQHVFNSSADRVLNNINEITFKFGEEEALKVLEDVTSSDLFNKYPVSKQNAFLTKGKRLKKTVEAKKASLNKGSNEKARLASQAFDGYFTGGLDVLDSSRAISQALEREEELAVASKGKTKDKHRANISNYKLQLSAIEVLESDPSLLRHRDNSLAFVEKVTGEKADKGELSSEQVSAFLLFNNIRNRLFPKLDQGDPEAVERYLAYTESRSDAEGTPESQIRKGLDDTGISDEEKLTDGELIERDFKQENKGRGLGPRLAELVNIGLRSKGRKLSHRQSKEVYGIVESLLTAKDFGGVRDSLKYLISSGVDFGNTEKFVGGRFDLFKTAFSIVGYVGSNAVMNTFLDGVEIASGGGDKARDFQKAKNLAIKTFHNASSEVKKQLYSLAPENPDGVDDFIGTTLASYFFNQKRTGELADLAEGGFFGPNFSDLTDPEKFGSLATIVDDLLDNVLEVKDGFYIKSREAKGFISKVFGVDFFESAPKELKGGSFEDSQREKSYFGLALAFNSLQGERQTFRFKPKGESVLGFALGTGARAFTSFLPDKKVTIGDQVPHSKFISRSVFSMVGVSDQARRGEFVWENYDQLRGLTITDRGIFYEGVDGKRYPLTFKGKQISFNQKALEKMADAMENRSYFGDQVNSFIDGFNEVQKSVDGPVAKNKKELITKILFNSVLGITAGIPKGVFNLFKRRFSALLSSPDMDPTGQEDIFSHMFLNKEEYSEFLKNVNSEANRNASSVYFKGGKAPLSDPYSFREGITKYLKSLGE